MLVQCEPLFYKPTNVYWIPSNSSNSLNDFGAAYPRYKELNCFNKYLNPSPETIKYYSDLLNYHKTIIQISNDSSGLCILLECIYDTAWTSSGLRGKYIAIVYHQTGFRIINLDNVYPVSVSKMYNGDETYSFSNLRNYFDNIFTGNMALSSGLNAFLLNNRTILFSKSRNKEDAYLSIDLDNNLVSLIKDDVKLTSTEAKQINTFLMALTNYLKAFILRSSDGSIAAYIV